MASYVSVVWTTGDVLTEAKLDNMVANDQSEDAHAANGMIMNNNVAYRAKQAGGTTKDVIKLGTDDILKLSQLRYDDDGTPATKENVMIQNGWGWVIGDNTPRIEETVTFPTAFDTLLSLQITANGFKTSDPTSFTDMAATDTSFTANTAQISTSAFRAIIAHQDPTGSLGDTTRYMYSWVAIGVKA